MYSHTRACSISRRASGLEQIPISIPQLEEMPSGLVELMRLMCCHNDVLEHSVEQQKTHMFALHMLELANAYNGFYRDCHVLNEDLVDGFFYQISELGRSLLRTGLEGLGISAIEQM